MKKFLYSFVFVVLFCNTSFAQNPPLSIEECKKHYPIISLDTSGKNIIEICRKGYLSNYDKNAKIPFYVTYLFIPDHAIGCSVRSNKFEEDISIPLAFRSTLKDYSGSFYDRGHMAPDDDMAWDNTTEIESFILSNMTPQTPNFNRGVWKSLETYARNVVFSGKTLQIISGAVYNKISPNQVIGNGVVVPSGFFKILIDVNTKEYLVFLFDFSDKNQKSKNFYDYQISLKDLETKIGVKILGDIQKDKKNSVWVFGSGLQNKKKITCN